MNVDFFFTGGDFNQTYAVVFPVTEKAREHFGVNLAVVSMHVNKSDLNELLNRADRDGVTFQDMTNFKIMK
jgi:hypothetical protein